MNYYAGIDNSSTDHKIRIIDENGNQDLSLTIDNTFKGFVELNEKLSLYSDLIIGFELPHGPIVDYLHDKKYHLYSLNPLKIKRFKESIIVSGNKNDEIDAKAIADYLRKNRDIAREMIFNSSELEKLRTLCVIHTRTMRNHARHLNKLHFAVRQYFPLMDSLFSDFGCTIQLEMINKYPTFYHLREASDDEILQFLQSHKYYRQRNADRIIKKIREHQQLIAPEVEYSYSIEAKCLCKLIQELNHTLAILEKEMIQITDSHYLGKYFRSLPGAGQILASKLLALWGDEKDRFVNGNGAQCLFGTAPKNYQSGSFHKIMMRKACDKEARAILYKFAFASLRFSPWARAYYDKLRKKGKKHSVALRALSNKWVLVMYRMWKDEHFYKESEKISTAA
jgi:transposase